MRLIAEPGRSWAEAPCILLTLDRAYRVVAVNERYLASTGHSEQDVLGRPFWDDLVAVGSRIFFQTQLAPVLQLDHRLDEVMVDLRTADGGRLPALLNATSAVGPDGRPAETTLALMSVPDRRAFEDGLRRARADAEQARHDAETARLRLELLAQASAALTTGSDVEVALRGLAEVLTARLADWCVIQRIDRDDAASRGWSATHADPARQDEVERFAESLVSGPSDELWSPADAATVIAAPVSVRGVRTATIVVGRDEQREPFGIDDFADITDVAARAGIVIDNLRRQAREHSNSVTLQHALLTTPPTAPGFEIATRYQPATDGNDIGGDWYDALVRADASPILVIGDVLGHDIHAAAAMGQLRGIVRTLAYTTGGSPAEILSRADDTAYGLGVRTLATTLVARIRADGTAVHWSNAGHPPPLLITATGVQVLAAAPERLLGLDPTLRKTRADHTHSLAPGDVLVLYTDGLVERNDQSIDDAVTALADLVAAIPDKTTRSVDDLCDRILAARHGNTHDDIAMIVFRAADRAERSGIV